jgi:hypothetical protein
MAPALPHRAITSRSAETLTDQILFYGTESQSERPVGSDIRTSGSAMLVARRGQG